MVRLVALGLCIAFAACSSPGFNKPIKLPPHGAAVRGNMAAHIINPNPPPRAPRVYDANRAVLATEQYRTNEVEKTASEEGKSLTGAAE